MKVTIDDVIKLAREYIEEQGMKYTEALERAKKELGYSATYIE
jgi:hypothetical protein